MTPTLDNFCRRAGLAATRRARPGPESMAHAFVRFFNLSLRPGMDELTYLLHAAGVGSVAGVSLPSGLRGIHYSAPGGGYDVRYEENQWQGASEHTLLHETYEIIHETLRVGRGVNTPPERICREADRFAAAVLMQPAPFAAFAMACGLDIVALQRAYRRSYASVALRLVEVMRRQPLMAVLYEGDAPSEDPYGEGSAAAGLRAVVVARTPGFEARRSCHLGGRQSCAPIRGAPPPHGSAAEHAALTGRPAYVEHPGNDGIALAVRPVLWAGRVAKVAATAVPYGQRASLLPQLAKGRFERLLLDQD